MKSEQAFANRLEAEMRGDKTYLGIPCKHGHDGTRFTRNNVCVECQEGYNAARSPHGHGRRLERSMEAKAAMDAMRPDPPTNRVPANGWPFGECFEDDPRAANAGIYIENLRKLPFVRAA